MRLLHTSDWHLGDRLGWVDRTAEQLDAVDRVLAYCRDYAVDVLLVAGDVFEDYRGPFLSSAVTELAFRLEPLLRDGMHAVFIPGNHDREHLFRLLEAVQALSISGASHLVFASEFRTVHLPDRTGQQTAAFVLAPYPLAHRYLPPGTVLHGLTATERHQAVAAAFTDRLSEARASIDPGTAAVLVAHAYLQTAQEPNLFRMTVAEDILVDPSGLSAWSYAALGHVHKPQVIGGNEHVRYSGSCIRLDAGEEVDEKSCVLVDLDQSGAIRDLALLPLPARPVYSVELEGCDGLDDLPRFYGDHAEALVRVRLAYRPGLDSAGAALVRLREIFPNMYAQDIHAVGSDAVGRRLQTDRQDLAATVAGFLSDKLEGHPRRDALLALAQELVEEVRDAATSS